MWHIVSMSIIQLYPFCRVAVTKQEGELNEHDNETNAIFRGHAQISQW